MHSLTNECPHGRDIATATGKDVQRLIASQATKGKAYVAHLPLWFPAGDTPQGLTQCEFAPFTELMTFNKYWGALGYVPVLHDPHV